MQKIKIEKTMEELQPKYDSRQSFYRKAFVITLTYKDSKIYLLKSYDSLVCTITENSEGVKWYYLNKLIDIDLLTSQTTLRHIREFLNQFYKNKEYKKEELIKNALDHFYFEILDNEAGDIDISMTNYQSILNATTPEQTRFFKSTFKGYKEKKVKIEDDVYLLTSSAYGISNHYYVLINQFMKD